MGGGARDTCAITREMAKICLGITTAFFALQLGADPIIVGGTKKQKQKWLGAIAEGTALVAYAVTEPDAGSNVAAIKTKADPVTNDAGDIIGYKINGSKQFISTGLYADFITLLANTPDGATFFVVEKDTEGYIRGKSEEKHGIRASNTSPLTFTDAFVPVENLIGDIPGHGLKQATKVFGYTRLMVAAMALGGGEAALDVAIAYAKERIQFKTPLSEKQGYTHKLILPHVIRLSAAEAYIEEVAERLDSGEKELVVEGSIAKLFTTESADRTAGDGLSVGPGPWPEFFVGDENEFGGAASLAQLAQQHRHVSGKRGLLVLPPVCTARRSFSPSLCSAGPSPAGDPRQHLVLAHARQPQVLGEQRRVAAQAALAMVVRGDASYHAEGGRGDSPSDS